MQERFVSMSETGHLLSGVIESGEEQEAVSHVPIPQDPSILAPNTSIYPCYPSLCYEQPGPSPSLEVAAAGPFPSNHSYYHHHQQQQQQQQYYGYSQMPDPTLLYATIPTVPINPCEIKIVVEPMNRMRFRYGSEKGSHGALAGKSSAGGKKTFPTVKLENCMYTHDPIFVEASLYTNDPQPKRHVHRLKGTGCENGICTVEVDKRNMTAVFQNLSIEYVGKKEVPNILYERKLEEMRNTYGHSECAMQLTAVQEKAAKEAKIMNLNVVMIQFEAYIQTENNRERLGSAVYSNPIYNQKATDTGELKISRMDKYSGSCEGNEEVFLLCDKVNKKDIEIIFYEKENEKIVWEERGSFTEADVHYQVAIVFKTPPYRYTNIEKSVEVLIELRRPSDDDRSEPKSFVYHPVDKDKEGVQTKKRKIASCSSSSYACESQITYSAAAPLSAYGGSTSASDTGDRSSNTGGSERMHTNIDSEDSISEKELEDFIKSLMKSNFLESSDVSNITESSQIQNDAEQLQIPNIVLSPIPNVPELSQTPENLYANILQYQEESLPSPLLGAHDPLFSSTSSMFISQAGVYPPSPPGYVTPDSVPMDSPEFLAVGMSNLRLNDGGNRNEEELHKNGGDRNVTFKNILKYLKWYNATPTLPELTELTMSALRNYMKTGKMLSFLSEMCSLMILPNKDGDNILHLTIIHQPTNESLYPLLNMMKMFPKDTINHTNNLKQTALHLAVINNRPSFICELLNAGANPSIKDHNGNTVLHLTVLNCDEACLQELLFSHHSGLEIDSLNYEGIAALHMAVKKGFYRLVELLCQAGADINIADGKSGCTPLHHAIEFCPSLVEYLLSQPAIDVDVQDYKGDTPLHLACAHGLEDVVSLLMQHDANPLIKNYCYDLEEDETDEDGKTPLNYAVNNAKIIKILAGESPKEPPESDEKNETKIEQSYNIHDSGYQSREIAFLDNALLAEICQLMDPPNKGWESLAHILVDTVHFSRVRRSASPTREVLRSYSGTFEEFLGVIQFTLTDQEDLLKLLENHGI